jgi:hypothetical protein
MDTLWHITLLLKLLEVKLPELWSKLFCQFYLPKEDVWNPLDRWLGETGNKHSETYVTPIPEIEAKLSSRS